MAVLVTRPQPDADATASALRDRGYDALVAPVLRFESLPVHLDDGAAYAALIVTSANALRDPAALAAVKNLPVFAVGERTAEVARAAGFGPVEAAEGDAIALRDLVAKRLKPREPLLYLAGADLSHDLAGDLGARGFTVMTQTAYRMTAVPALTLEAADAVANGGVQAVLHYSRRSARAFVEAARASGVEVTALALPQICLSDAVAVVMRDGGAARIAVAARPDQNALFEVLDGAIRAGSE